jgi:hypothetical protein
MQLLGEAIARDTEYIMINGDTVSSDPLLAKLDGILKQVTAHTVDAAGARLSRTLLKSALKTLPHEYLYDVKALRFLTSHNAQIDYSEEVGDRATQAGDRAAFDYVEPMFKRVPVMAIPEFPEDLTPGNETEVILTDPKNFHVGFHRKIKIRVHEDYQSGAVIIVGRIRFDGKFANPDATVKIENVLAS